jgi:hypothetical protein
MCGATPSRTGPICTVTPLVGSFSAKVAVQFGGANAASSRVRPTLRASTSNAVTTRRSSSR